MHGRPSLGTACPPPPPTQVTSLVQYIDDEGAAAAALLADSADLAESTLSLTRATALAASAARLHLERARALQAAAAPALQRAVPAAAARGGPALKAAQRGLLAAARAAVERASERAARAPTADMRKQLEGQLREVSDQIERFDDALAGTSLVEMAEALAAVVGGGLDTVRAGYLRGACGSLEAQTRGTHTRPARAGAGLHVAAPLHLSQRPRIRDRRLRRRDGDRALPPLRRGGRRQRPPADGDQQARGRRGGADARGSGRAA